MKFEMILHGLLGISIVINLLGFTALLRCRYLQNEKHFFGIVKIYESIRDNGVKIYGYFKEEPINKREEEIYQAGYSDGLTKCRMMLLDYLQGNRK